MILIKGENQYLGLRVPRNVSKFLKQYEEDRKIGWARIHAWHSDNYGNNSAIGIHLLDPTLEDIQDALESADRDGFERIFCYYPPRSKAVKPILQVFDGGKAWAF